MYKPVILIGNGIRNDKVLVDYLLSLGIPLMTTWMSIDLIPEDHPSFCGRPGSIGQRAANIIMQKASALYMFGARMDDEQRAFSWNIAPNGKKIVYDVDPAERSKFPKDWEITMRPHFFTKRELEDNTKWLAWCKELYNKFRPELEGEENSKFVNPFKFISVLSDLSKPTDILAVGSSAMAPNTFMQAFKVKKGQRITCLPTIGAMGADIPMAIGACIGSGEKRTICVTGDGGFMLNMPELEVVKRLVLPIKFFVYTNNCYGSIRNMQDSRFKGRHVGCDPESGFTIPELYNVARCFDIDFFFLNRVLDKKYMEEILNYVTPSIVQVSIDPEWKQLPRVVSTMKGGILSPDSFEDMTPHLPEEELKKLMEWDG